MSGLTLRNIVKSYGAQPVLHGIDLAIADREFIVFVGPSGCGKSTLLRVIAGLEDIDEGTVHIGGRDVTDLEPVDRGIAMVFQSYALYPHMTVAENMSFGLRVTGVDSADIEKRVAEAAGTLQLEPYLKRKPSQLSGGQRQRVAIGRAIVRRPEVFLLDEPLSNLDAELRVHMRIELARLHHKLGSTMIYVTHDQVEAMTLADRIVVLQDGLIQQIGSPMQLFDDPDNLFVAGFIGSPKINLLPVHAVDISDEGRVDVALETPAGPVVRVPTRAAIPRGDNLTLGIRPEHITLSDGPSPLRATADVTEQMGETGYLYAETGEGNRLTVEIRGRSFPPIGEEVGLDLDPSRMLLFDKHGVRLR